MAKKAEKSLEKLETEYQKVLDTIRTNTQRKEALWQEMRSLQANTLLNALDDNHLTVQDTVQAMTLYQKIQESEMTVEDILELLISEVPYSETKAETESKSTTAEKPEKITEMTTHTKEEETYEETLF
ncbi:MAG: hypothetical protein LIO74_01265 [Ruminococcus sp.]|nr:hypothetical protein [Ruminococcus sp.]MCD7959588.1 hypothetical protein [Ruminococcus sp.]